MHIPSNMLNGQICPITAGLAVAGVAAASYFAVKSKNKPTPLRFAAVAAMIFAAQMVNFSISGGTSGHLLGGVLAATLLGTPFGVLAIGMVTAIQAVVFSDGGLAVLGANIVNMGIIGGGVTGIVYNSVAKMKLSKVKQISLIAALSWVSVAAASFACSIELGAAETIAFSKVVPAMFGVHAVIGVFEALMTVALVELFEVVRKRTSDKWNVALPLSASILTALILAPFASKLPDGLEWVAEKYRFLHATAPTFVTPLSDYNISFIKSEMVSTALAGAAGVAITFIVAYFVGRVIKKATVENK